MTDDPSMVWYMNDTEPHYVRGAPSAKPTGGLNDIEHSAFQVPLNRGREPDGGAVDYCRVSIAISLKRIADALEKIVGSAKR